MEKCVKILVCFCFLLLSPTMAGATFPDNCDHACLGDYQSVSCSSLCGDITGGVHCDLSEAGSDPAAIVYGFATAGDFLVFGSKGGTKFCCDDTDDFTANHLRIDTDADDDTVCVGRPGVVCDPPTTTCDWDAHSDWDFPTLIKTYGGDDDVYASDFGTSCGPLASYYCDDIELGTGGTYGDYAEGGGGGDRIGGVGTVPLIIYGEGGRDKIRGPDATSGMNYLYGGLANDVIYGGSGDDYIVVGPGDGAPVTKQWANGLDGEDTVLGDVTDDVLCGDWDTDSDDDTIGGSSGSDRCTHPTEDTLTSCETNDTFCNDAPF
jgi:Ca2+-binding RTX toxin-like protein